MTEAIQLFKLVKCAPSIYSTSFVWFKGLWLSLEREIWVIEVFGFRDFLFSAVLMLLMPLTLVGVYSVTCTCQIDSDNALRICSRVGLVKFDFPFHSGYTLWKVWVTGFKNAQNYYKIFDQYWTMWATFLLGVPVFWWWDSRCTSVHLHVCACHRITVWCCNIRGPTGEYWSKSIDLQYNAQIERCTLKHF